MTAIPFDPRRFRSTAAFYGRYRAAYPDALIATVAARAGLAPGARVLDLGAGPAPLGIAFAKRGMAVTAMDPEPEMLAAARQAMADAGVVVELVEGSSFDLSRLLSPDAPFALVAMGRSFHWMDRAATLRSLDRLVAPEGAVVLFHERRILSQPDWRAVADELATVFSGGRLTTRDMRRAPDWLPHEALLLDSAFSHLEGASLTIRQTLTTDAVVGRVSSMSSTSPQALGADRASFEARLRARLRELAPDDRFAEILEMGATLAFRRAPAV